MEWMLYTIGSTPHTETFLAVQKIREVHVHINSGLAPGLEKLACTLKAMKCSTGHLAELLSGPTCQCKEQTDGTRWPSNAQDVLLTSLICPEDILAVDQSEKR